MTTLISWGNSAGEHRRCDANCHTARKPKCDCICGGKYHGVAARFVSDTDLEATGRRVQEVMGGQVILPPLQLTFDDLLEKAALEGVAGAT